MRKFETPVSCAAFAAALVFACLFVLHGNVAVVRATKMCDAELDAVMVMDGSGSMSGNYHNVQNFARDFVSKFKVPPTRFGVIQYSDSVSLQTTLTDSTVSINNAIGRAHMRGTTDTSAALYAAQNEINARGRSSAAKLIVLISDGQPNSVSNALNAANSVKSQGTIIVA